MRSVLVSVTAAPFLCRRLSQRILRAVEACVVWLKPRRVPGGGGPPRPGQFELSNHRAAVSARARRTSLARWGPGSWLLDACRPRRSATSWSIRPSSPGASSQARVSLVFRMERRPASALRGLSGGRWKCSRSPATHWPQDGAGRTPDVTCAASRTRLRSAHGGARRGGSVRAALA